MYCDVIIYNRKICSCPVRGMLKHWLCKYLVKIILSYAKCDDTTYMEIDSLKRMTVLSCDLSTFEELKYSTSIHILKVGYFQRCELYNKLQKFMSLEEFNDWKTTNNIDNFCRLERLYGQEYALYFDNIVLQQLRDHLMYRYAYVPPEISLERFDTLMKWALKYKFYVR